MIEAEIIINATPEKVREAFLQFETYPEWAKFIEKVVIDKPDGKSLVKGDKLVVSLFPDPDSKMDMTPTVQQNDENEFRWLGQLGFTGIFDGEHRFQFEKYEEDKTRLVQSEKFSGILSYPILWYIGEKTKKGFANFNEALKKRVESS